MDEKYEVSKGIEDMGVGKARSLYPRRCVSKPDVRSQ